MESWRDILERAAANLSIDLRDRPREAARAGAAPKPYRLRQSRFAAYSESRERLARELEAMSTRRQQAPAPQPAWPAMGVRSDSAVSAPSPAHVERLFAVDPRVELQSAKAGGGWRNVLAIALSAGVLYLVGYAFLHQKDTTSSVSVSLSAKELRP